MTKASKNQPPKLVVSAYVLELLGCGNSLRRFMQAVAYATRRGTTRIPRRRFPRKKDVRTLVELGILEVNDDDIEYFVLNDRVRGCDVRLFWIKSKDKQPCRVGQKKRFAVMRRDGFRCVYCGATAQSDQLHVDHVRSIADGGTSEPSNLVTACSTCNIGKGAQSLELTTQNH